MDSYTIIDAEKALLRKRMRALRQSFVRDEEKLKIETSSVWDAVENDPIFVSAHTVLIYMDIPGEVPTLDFIRRRYLSKRFVLPVVCGGTLQLREYVAEKLVPGYRGILEPSLDSPLVKPSEVDYALVPGVAFTADGRRLGRGGGYYDRLLPALNCKKTGVGFSFRLLDNLPSGPNDAVLDAVICAGLLTQAAEQAAQN